MPTQECVLYSNGGGIFCKLVVKMVMCSDEEEQRQILGNVIFTLIPSRCCCPLRVCMRACVRA
jgi:hypothetical protein